MEHFTKIAKWNEVVIATDSTRKRHQKISEQIAEKTKSIEQLTQASNRKSGSGCEPDTADPADLDRLKELKQELKDLKASRPVLDTTMAVIDHKKPVDLRIHVRGSHLMQSEIVPRGFPKVLISDNNEHQIRSGQSGRLQFV